MSSILDMSSQLLNSNTSSTAGIQGIHCFDYGGRIISRGVQYIPGPDLCLHCVCEEGGPQMCRAILCQPPPTNPNHECKPTRVKTSCCDFKCAEIEHDIRKYGISRNGDVGVIIPKTIVSAILSLIGILIIFYLINRLRHRQFRGRMHTLAALNRSRQLYDECVRHDPLSRSLEFSLYPFERGSIGRNSSDGINNQHLFPPPQYVPWWKPPVTSQFPRSEPPPPYEEAISNTNDTFIVLPAPSISLNVNNNSRNELPSNIASTEARMNIQSQFLPSTESSGVDVRNETMTNSPNLLTEEGIPTDESKGLPETNQHQHGQINTTGELTLVNNEERNSDATTCANDLPETEESGITGSASARGSGGHLNHRNSPTIPPNVDGFTDFPHSDHNSRQKQHRRSLQHVNVLWDGHRHYLCSSSEERPTTLSSQSKARTSSLSSLST